MQTSEMTNFLTRTKPKQETSVEIRNLEINSGYGATQRIPTWNGNTAILVLTVLKIIPVGSPLTPNDFALK